MTQATRQKNSEIKSDTRDASGSSTDAPSTTGNDAATRGVDAATRGVDAATKRQDEEEKETTVPKVHGSSTVSVSVAAATV